MEIDFLTLVLTSFFVGYLISFFKNRSKDKKIRTTVDKYLKLIKRTVMNNKDGLSAMEYNDRYTITFNNKEDMLGMVRLLKAEKKLIVLDSSLQLTDTEYENLLESIKMVL